MLKLCASYCIQNVKEVEPPRITSPKRHDHSSCMSDQMTCYSYQVVNDSTDSAAFYRTLRLRRTAGPDRVIDDDVENIECKDSQGRCIFMYDETAKKATLKYMKEKRENLNLNFSKGKKAIFKAYAQFRGMSLTELITQLIEEDMEKHHFIPEEEKSDSEQ